MKRGWVVLGLLLGACSNDWDGILAPAEATSTGTGPSGNGGAGSGAAPGDGGAGGGDTGGAATATGGTGGAADCSTSRAEDCDNLLDDDADGEVDCLDDACQGCAACDGAVFVAPDGDGDGSFASPTGDLAGAMRGCGQVYLRPGTYHEAVVVPPDCKLVGSGAEVTTIDATGSDTSAVSVPDGGTRAVVAYLTVSRGAADEGGGIRLQSGGLLVRDAVVSDNQATRGGGIFAADSASLDVVRSKLVDNTADDRGGGAYVAAGGQWTSVDVLTNQAQNGGGVHIDGAEVTMLAIWLGANQATNGGGLRIDGGSLEVDRILVSDNVVSAGGGGLLLENATVIVRNGLLVRNTASADGGAIYAGEGDVALAHLTMSGNDSTGNAAIHCPGPTVTMRNSIVWDNDGGQAVASECDVQYSNYSGGSSAQNNLSGDPLFVDPAASDWHLEPGSPCRDQGDPALGVAVDLDNNPRDGMPDMGAFEIQ